MPYYNQCPNCGANLDPGEVCECDHKRKKENAGQADEKEYQIKTT